MSRHSIKHPYVRCIRTGLSNRIGKQQFRPDRQTSLAKSKRTVFFRFSKPLLSAWAKLYTQVNTGMNNIVERGRWREKCMAREEKRNIQEWQVIQTKAKHFEIKSRNIPFSGNFSYRFWKLFYLLCSSKRLPLSCLESVAARLHITRKITLLNGLL